MKIKVNSEIGKLKKVLVHRPGKEVERLYPEIYERLLFDGIMYTDVAQQEHDVFTSKLRENGVEVLYIEEQVAEALTLKPEAKEIFADRYVELAGIENEAVKVAVKKYLLSFKDNKKMVDASIAGIKKTEIQPDFKNKLSDHIEQHQEYPFYVDPIPNILFQRDPIASIFGGMSLHNMNRETRKREKLYYEIVFKFHPDFMDIDNHILPTSIGTMEGGDVLVISKETIFVGISERTTAKAAEELAEILFEKYDHLKRVIGIEIPHSHATMHLDTILTQMDKTLFSIDPDMYKENYTYYEITRDGLEVFKNTHILNLLRKYVHPDTEVIQVGGGDIVRAKREQWNDGANCLAIAPGKIVVYERNVITNALVAEAGVEVIAVPSSELSLGRGGPRCMSMPLEREDI
ncbi:arginine deiminase [Mycoplasma todarodis]|uniref:arginine deiminase n=1 Tax=Mycoplasma todarodis TaxID=1937191 RepID=UPI003B3942EE